jgi:hypothetical protein
MARFPNPIHRGSSDSRCSTDSIESVEAELLESEAMDSLGSPDGIDSPRGSPRSAAPKTSSKKKKKKKKKEKDVFEGRRYEELATGEQLSTTLLRPAGAARAGHTHRVSAV